ncbi:osteoclast stimulatory transmembrane protein [Engraulis encrasicolus]|uniref:osteoclast stimulatory transmembrane protein n=1 Tax=Engraulis encrasicolus TaxID=184585 RepID=UPI002FD653A7
MKPVPHGVCDFLTLLLECVLVAIVTGAGLWAWLRGSDLQYGAQGAGVCACVCGACVFLATLLLHPARCALVVMAPTLGCDQGRRLLLAAAVIVTLLHAPSNMARNTHTLTHTLKCSAKNVARSVLDSSEVMNSVKEDVVAVVTAYKALSSYVQSLHSFNQHTHVNLTAVTHTFKTVTHRLENDLRQVQGQLGVLKTAAQRLLAAILVCHLLWSSASYLHGYLSRLDYDNVYLTPRLRQLAHTQGVQIGHTPFRHAVDATGYRLSRQEVRSCVPALLLVSLYFLLCGALVALDFLLYRVVAAGNAWIREIPDTNVTLGASFKVSVDVPVCKLLYQDCSSDVLVFQRDYSWPIRTGAERCGGVASPPSGGAVVLLIMLFTLSYALVPLQVYARRLRRAIAASFFGQQEQQRVHFLLQRITAKGEGLFTIATT